MGQVRLSLNIHVMLFIEIKNEMKDISQFMDTRES